VGESSGHDFDIFTRYFYQDRKQTISSSNMFICIFVKLDTY